MTPSITISQAVTLINDSILDFEDGLTNDTIQEIIFAVNNELQVRDYLMGLPNTFPMETCKAFLSYLSDSAGIANSYAVDTVLSAYCYETEDMVGSMTFLATALDTKPDYSLAKLIGRVMQAGWPADSFGKMRLELHSKVLDEIANRADELIVAE